MGRREQDRTELSLEDRAFYGLVWTGHKLTSRVERELTRQHQLPLSWFEVLLWLSRRSQPMSVSALGDCAMLSRSQISRVLDVLDRRGLIVRALSDTDARTVHVAITAQGRRLFDAADVTRRECLADVFTDRLTGDDLAALARIWDTLKNREEK